MGQAPLLRGGEPIVSLSDGLESFDHTLQDQILVVINPRSCFLVVLVVEVLQTPEGSFICNKNQAGNVLGFLPLIILSNR